MKRSMKHWLVLVTALLLALSFGITALAASEAKSGTGDTPSGSVLTTGELPSEAGTTTKTTGVEEESRWEHALKTLWWKAIIAFVIALIVTFIAVGVHKGNARAGKRNYLAGSDVTILHKSESLKESHVTRNELKK